MFDPHRPPEQTIVDDCIHCGFCLDACPTYVLWAQEADSPRGRIVLVDEQLHSGRPALGRDRESFRLLPRLYGVRDRVSLRRALRPPDRARQAADRTQLQAVGARARAETDDLLHPPPSAPHASAAAGTRGRSPTARRRPARAAPGDGPTRSADASPPRPRPDTHARPGVRQTARPSGPAPGMRAARLLSAGARGHDRGARSRGLRGIRVAGARVLWRARASRRGGTGGDRARD